VIGWQLSRSLQSTLAVAALEQALESRRPPAGLVHHSDRGIQYASEDYTRILGAHGVLPSMSRAGNPWDNAACESFMKTLKAEQIDGRRYATLEELHQDIAAFLDGYYNRRRLHSSLGYCPPDEFEQQHASAAPAAAVMEFSEA
jgi:transposase InsO family protein